MCAQGKGNNFSQIPPKLTQSSAAKVTTARFLVGSESQFQGTDRALWKIRSTAGAANQELPSLLCAAREPAGGCHGSPQAREHGQEAGSGI